MKLVDKFSSVHCKIGQCLLQGESKVILATCTHIPATCGNFSWN